MWCDYGIKKMYQRNVTLRENSGISHEFVGGGGHNIQPLPLYLGSCLPSRRAHSRSFSAVAEVRPKIVAKKTSRIARCVTFSPRA